MSLVFILLLDQISLVKNVSIVTLLEQVTVNHNVTYH